MLCFDLKRKYVYSIAIMLVMVFTFCPVGIFAKASAVASVEGNAKIENVEFYISIYLDKSQDVHGGQGEIVFPADAVDFSEISSLLPSAYSFEVNPTSDGRIIFMFSTDQDKTSSSVNFLTGVKTEIFRVYFMLNSKTVKEFDIAVNNFVVSDGEEDTILENHLIKLTPTESAISSVSDIITDEITTAEPQTSDSEITTENTTKEKDTSAPGTLHNENEETESDTQDTTSPFSEEDSDSKSIIDESTYNETTQNITTDSTTEAQKTAKEKKGNFTFVLVIVAIIAVATTVGGVYAYKKYFSKPNKK